MIYILYGMAHSFIELHKCWEQELRPRQRSSGRRLGIRKGRIEPQESPWKFSSIYPQNQSLPIFCFVLSPTPLTLWGGCPPPSPPVTREPGRAPPRHAHGDLTSLVPHERLPEILFVPREKTPTGAAARGNP